MASRPLRLGVIGCGNIARRLHLPTWLSLPDVAEVVALADPHPANLAAAQQLAGLPDRAVHADPLVLIARDDVDAVDVCTPPHLRRNLLLAAAAGGKHILSEKPLAAVPSDAAAVVQEASDRGVTMGLVHTYLWLPEIRAVRDAIASGRIGEVRTVIVNYLGVVYEPGAAGDWRHDPAVSGGGVLMDMIHAVYVAEALLGEPLERVSAHVSSRAPSAHVEDQALCRFESATRAALVNVAWGDGPGGIEVAGTKGRITVRYRDGATAPWAPAESVTVVDPSSSAVVLGAGRERVGMGEFPSVYDSFQHNARDFAEAALAGRLPAASGADGLRVLEATVGAYESAATGAVVPIPLDRTSPVFERGAMGIPELDIASWSALKHSQLFRPLS